MDNNKHNNHDQNVNKSVIPPPPPPRAVSSFPSKISSTRIPKPIANNTTNPPPPFKPNTNFFFYGSLMDPEVLQTVLDLPEPPRVQSGSIYGFKIKMWGIYPAVVPLKEGKVPGTVWRISTADHLGKLSEYETAAYTRCPCEVHLDSGEILEDSQTFCWGGDPKSKELEDGQFDLVRYQRYFKDSVVRKRNTE